MSVTLSFSLSSPLHSHWISLFFCAVPVYCDSDDIYCHHQDTKDKRVSRTLSHNDVTIKETPTSENIIVFVVDVGRAQSNSSIPP